MSRQRVYFFNRFFWPDSSATAQILTDLCRGLDRRGRDVTVVTSRLNYSDSSVSYPSRESVDGVAVVRLWSTRFGRTSLPGRLADYLTIYLSFFLFMLRELSAGDVAVFKTDPPLLSIPGAIARSVKGFEMIAWCQDIFPEVAISELQGSGVLRRISSLLAGARDWSLGCADAVVVLGEDMARFVEDQGIARRKLWRISNWSVQEEQTCADGRALRKMWDIPDDSFVVGYSGNLGRAHDWKTVLAAADLLKEETDLLFLCCGGGHGYEMLKSAVAGGGLAPLFRFLPYQPLSELASSLRVPDVHWLSLKADLSPFIFPSKFFGILQAGRPMLFIGSTDGEIAELIRRDKIGTAVAEGDATGLASAILELKAHRSALEAAGQRARKLWETRYQKRVEINKWERLLQQFSPQRKGLPDA